MKKTLSNSTFFLLMLLISTFWNGALIYFLLSCPLKEGMSHLVKIKETIDLHFGPGPQDK